MKFEPLQWTERVVEPDGCAQFQEFVQTCVRDELRGRFFRDMDARPLRASHFRRGVEVDGDRSVLEGFVAGRAWSAIRFSRDRDQLRVEEAVAKEARCLRDVMDREQDAVLMIRASGVTRWYVLLDSRGVLLRVLARGEPGAELNGV